jgi:hypothetical protein
MHVCAMEYQQPSQDEMDAELKVDAVSSKPCIQPLRASLYLLPKLGSDFNRVRVELVVSSNRIRPVRGLVVCACFPLKFPVVRGKEAQVCGAKTLYSCIHHVSLLPPLARVNI